MKIVFDIHSGSVYARTVREFSKLMVVSLLAVVFLLSLSPVSAWSFETYHAQMDDQARSALSKTTLTSFPSQKYLSDSIQADSHAKDVTDHCLPLLSSERSVSPHTAMDRNRRSAGKAAALGLMFGVQFALSPNSGSSKRAAPDVKAGFWLAGTSPEAQQDTNRHALAVAAYRHCQKQQALEALSMRSLR